MAFFSLSPAGLKERAEAANSQQAGSERAFLLKLLRFIEKPKRLFITLSIGNTMSNIAAFIVSAIFSQKLVSAYEIPPALGYVTTIILIVPIVIIFGEVVPKVIGAKNPEKFSRRAYPFVWGAYMVLYPLSTLVLLLTKFFEKVAVRVKGMKTISAKGLTNDEIKEIADAGFERGELKESERHLIDNILDFRDQIVRKVMTPRTDIVAIDTKTPFEEAVQMVLKMRHSRLPLYEEDLDNILGVVYAKDLIRFIPQDKKFEREDWVKIARPPIFVPETQRLDELLKTVQKKRTHLAIVVDEYGSTAGVVTLEDIIGEIIGEIVERPVQRNPEYRKLEENVFWFDARMSIEEVFDLLGKKHDEQAEGAFEYDTLGGFILNLSGGIPNEKQHLEYEDSGCVLDIEIEKLLGQRILSAII
ncbi:MAG: HlyC/CorC family transporter, partial [Chlorobiales bacterium]|nr:HlyC/CorC family transporter [Chlorobiales bacterium]